MSSQEQQEVVYEEEEVLWAKIRGYPWWPAFVDKLHPPVRGKETEYTVFFFGDNTQYSSSKLGASKLRKFYENYAEFYQKARAHRKLMGSIQMAEEKLRQNDQNIEIFQELRNTLKLPKKIKNSPIERKSSKISEPDPEILEDKEQLLELRIAFLNQDKSKTVTITRGRRSLAAQDEEQQLPHSENQSQKNRLSIKKQQVTYSSQKKSKAQQKKEEASPPAKRKKKSKQEIFEEEQQQKQQQKIAIEKQQTPLAQEIEAEEQQQQESIVAQDSIEEEEPRQESSDGIVYEKKLRNSVKRKVENQRGLTGPRKRGRPKKKLLRHHEQQEKTEVRSRPINRFSHLKRKIIRKVKASPKKPIDLTAAPLSEQDSHIIERVRQLLHRRQQLIDYLSSVGITISNVQQILELGVSNILQEGEKTHQVNQLLFALRNVLLYKYFPDDIKHKKKYEKILKKKHIVIKSDEMERWESQQNFQEQEIRKKTVVKLQKFLKAHPDIEQKGKQLAVQIESYFQKADKAIGDKYKSIAFKVLSNLKDRKQSFTEVIQKLDEHAYD